MLAHCGTITLNTPRLTLRRFERGDAGDMLAHWVADPAVQFMYGEPVYETPDAVNGLLDKYISAYEREDCYRWALIEKASGICTGMVAFFLVDSRNQFCELEYCIGRAFQRRGYVSEAVRAVVDFGFERVNFHKIQVCHRASNVASRGVIAKYGFTYEGALRDYFFTDGTYQDRLYYSMLRSEWEAQTK